jgi:predicted metal-dependent peptidase
MALTKEEITGYVERLLLSRMRILCRHGFYGLLLMHVSYAVSEEVETACTDGKTITFGTEFLKSLSDSELDFVMMHEILHIVLQHCLRQEERDNDAFNIACDIVVNSTVLYENGMDNKAITLKEYGESMHLAPDGKEGHLYTAEQVYDMLPKAMKQPKRGGSSQGDGKSTSQDGNAPSSSGGKPNSGKSGGGAKGR